MVWWTNSQHSLIFDTIQSSRLKPCRYHMRREVVVGAPVLITSTGGVTFALQLHYANAALQVERRSVMLRQMAAEDAPEAAAVELKAKAETHESQVRILTSNYTVSGE